MWASPERLAEALETIRERFAGETGETLRIAARRPPVS